MHYSLLHLLSLLPSFFFLSFLLFFFLHAFHFIYFKNFSFYLFSLNFLSLTFCFVLFVVFSLSLSKSPLLSSCFFPGARRKDQLLQQTVRSHSTGTAGTEENSVSSVSTWFLNNIHQPQSRIQEFSSSSAKGFVDVSHKQQNKKRCSGLAYLCSKHSPWLNKKAPMN